MKRALVITLSAVGLLVVVPAVVVNLVASGAEPVARPDPSRLITLPGGEQRTLAELIAPWEDGGPPLEALDVPPPPAPDPQGAGAASPEDGRAREERLLAEVERQLEQLEELRNRPPDSDDPYDLADWHLRQGSVEDAKALLLALPESHPRWARAQRKLGWDCFTRGDGTPARGVPFVHASLAADPTDGNAWQDAARVYARTLGLPFD